MDYVTIPGISTRTGVEETELAIFIVKELVDNALDFVEKNTAVNNNNKKDNELAQVQVFVLRESKYLKIRVLNLNFGISVFTENIINSIFDFGGFYSSKRNLYKIGRGALGDALKEVVSIPYALAEQNGIERWNKPLIITSGNKRYLIRIIVDRVRQTIHSQVEVKLRTQKVSSTELEVCIPIVDALDIESIESLLMEYALLNAHMSFHFELKLDKGGDGNSPVLSDIHNNSGIASNWSNFSSIYYCSPSDFRRFVLGLSRENDDTPAYEILKKNFREGTNIKKDMISLTTVGELKLDQGKINELYERLRKVMRPKTKVEVSFDVKGRRESIEKRIKELGYKVYDVKYRSKHGYYKSPDGNFEFPFFFEIAVVTTADLPQDFLYIEGINSSPQHYYTFLKGPPDTFIWHIRNNGKINTAGNIFEILEKYGYSYNKERCRKRRSIVIVNLISPRIDYKSYGKSDINLEPFAGVVADIVSRACSGGVTRNDASSDNSENRPLTAEALLTSLLKDRLSNIEDNPAVKYTDRWTQSTAFYRLRPILIAKGINVSRRYVTSQIRKVCEEKLGMKREELGIIAADRAQLYFRGSWHDVGLDELPQLMHMGTDLLIIEKEGVAEVLGPFADKKGIALLNTRGFLTEYATILSDLSRQNGCNVSILTDFDASGLLLAKKVPSIYRLGIDFGTLDYFGLTPTEIEEEYEPDNNHMKPLKYIASNSNCESEDVENYALTDYLQFVNSKRIEIDSVLAKVGNQRFWNFIIYKLDKKFRTRNYNRSVNIPEYIMPSVLEELIRKVNSKVAVILAPKRGEIIRDLSHVQGFIEPLEEKEEEIKAVLQREILCHEDIRPIITQIQNLIYECKL